MNKVLVMRAGLWLAIFGLLVWAGYHRLDPDYGWHVTMGKYITEKGIPKTDPFSYTMASYPFIDHEWLTNVIMYQLDQTIGKNGMAWIFAGMVTLALGLGGWGIKNKAGWEAAVIMAATLLFARGGVRPQVIDWLGLVVLWRGFADRQVWRKWRWIIPPAFCLWANLHGGFAVGVVVLGWLIFWRSLEEKKADIKDVMVWGLGLLGTMLGPYGWRVWHEVRMQITDHDLRWTISEWQPFYVVLEPAFWMLGTLLVMLGFKYRKIIPRWQTATTVVLLVAGMASLRHIGLLAVVGGLMLGQLLGVFVRRELKTEEAHERARRIYWGLLGLAAAIFIIPVGIEIRQGNFGMSFYPVEAVKYLKTQITEGNVFSDYGWGGYLIWKYPEKKVFIDGRMPSWRWPAYAKASAGKSAPEGESNWAMKDYLKISTDGEYEELFAKYDIRTVLWTNGERVTSWQKLCWDAEMAVRKWLGLKPIELQESFIEKMKESGWVEVYSDRAAVVYRKN